MSCVLQEFFDMKKTTLFLILFVSWQGWAQFQPMAWGNYYYMNNDFSKAIAFFEKSQDSLPLAAQQKLARAYLKVGQNAAAKALFQRIVQQPMADVEDYFLYAQLLTDKPKLSREYQAKARRLPVTYQSLWAQDSLLYKQRFLTANDQHIRPVNVNSKEAEFAPMIVNANGISELWYVTSQKMKNEKKRLKRFFSNHPIYNLAKTPLDSDQTTGEIQVLELGLNTVLQDGPMAYDADTKTLYLTRSAAQVAEDNSLPLDLYKTIYPNPENKPAQPLSINVSGTSSFHPAYDPVGKRLFFSSDRPGGMGGFDLWVAHRLPDGRFDAPINLGKDINTAANEVFPNWVMGQLSYASNTSEGVGGLDIWLANEVMANRWERTLLGAPYNSKADDFGWFYDSSLGLGMQTSARTEGKGEDDLYSFELKPDLVSEEDRYDYFVADTLVVSDQGVHQNDERQMALRDPLHRFFKRTYELDSQPQGELQWNSNGSFVYLNPLSGVVRDTFFYRIRTPYAVSAPTRVVLTQQVKSIKELPKDIQLTFDPIYFNVARADLLTQYKDRLDKVVSALTQYPKMIIRVNSYTDSRGREAYNQKLAEERFKTMIGYIEEALGEIGRVVGQAYGESKVPENDKKNFVAYAGSFGKRANAERLVTNLEKEGLSPFVVAEQGSLIRVGLGAFETRREALDFAQKMAAKLNQEVWVDSSPVNKKPDSFHRKQRRVTFEILNY